MNKNRKEIMKSLFILIGMSFLLINLFGIFWGVSEYKWHGKCVAKRYHYVFPGELLGCKFGPFLDWMGKEL